MPKSEYIDALVPSGALRTLNTVPLTDVAGRTVAHCSQVPPLLAHRSIREMRRADAPEPERRMRALREAGRRFAEEHLAGLSPSEYAHLAGRVTGLPVSTIRSSTEAIREAAREAPETARAAAPPGSFATADDVPPGEAGAVWLRRGQVLAVNAPGNHPAAHSTWLEALALGYRVVVRPSSRDPLTPQRLVTALRSSGFRNEEVVFLPGNHAMGEEIVREADLGFVYGGDDTVTRYVSEPAVLTQGPGRSKVLVSASTVDAVDVIVESVAGEGGTACTNATAVLVEGDPEPLAVEVAKRLAALPVLPPEEDGACLPVLPSDTARAVESAFFDRVGDGHVVLGEKGIAHELPDGSTALTPAVTVVEHCNDHRLRLELPFPCVWFAPWRPEDGLGALKESLVVSCLGCPDSVVERLVADPSIAGVNVGSLPTHRHSPKKPHDGYLSHFLMRGKGVIRS